MIVPEHGGNVAGAFLLLVSTFFLATSTVAYDNEEDCPCTIEDPPTFRKKEETARWMVHSLDWGVLSTISSRLQSSSGVHIPFGNVYSFVDGPCDNSTGIIYLYGTFLDQSFIDTKENNMVSFTLSEASMRQSCFKAKGLDRSCSIHYDGFGDPENPVCARLTLTGKLTQVKQEEFQQEYQWVQEAFFARHFSMKEWPQNHGWVIAKIELIDGWLIDFFGGAAILDLQKYYQVNVHDSLLEGKH